MLERQTLQTYRADEDSGQAFTPSYFYEILKRRALYFVIPFVLILGVGSLVVAAWPAKFLSRGTILVEFKQFLPISFGLRLPASRMTESKSSNKGL